MKKQVILIGVALVVGLLFTFSGCEMLGLSGSEPPDYVGTWKSKSTVGSPNGEAWQVVDLDESYVTTKFYETEDLEEIVGGYKGPLEVDGDEMTLQFKKQLQNGEWVDYEEKVTRTYSVSDEDDTLTVNNAEHELILPVE